MSMWVWKILYIRGGAMISKVRGLKHMFQRALSLVSPANPNMIGAKGQGKFLNLKSSRLLENATFFEYFLNYFVNILQ